MSAKSQLFLSCDLCKWPGKTFEDKHEAGTAGWLEVGQESYFDDRSFFGSWLCPSCVKKVIEAKKRAK